MSVHTIHNSRARAKEGYNGSELVRLSNE